MKILLINNDKGWSGGQEHLKDLASNLTQRGVEIHFLVREGSKSDNCFRELDLPVHTSSNRGFGRLTSIFRLALLLRRENFDIVSVNREHDLLSSALAWHIAFPLGKSGKFMMSYHTATKRPQLFLNTADAILCISEHVKAQLLKGNPTALNRIKVVHYGIALDCSPAAEKFNPDRQRRFFVNSGFPLIGMIGEFWKNQGELVEMIPALRRAFPGIKVAFVGDNTDPSLFAPILKQIQTLGVDDSVLFTGRIPRERIPDIFFDFDVSVTTHRNEGFGIVHLESLAAATPVITYNEGGMVDIFKGEDTGVVVSGGSEDFSDAVIDLLKDDETRFAMGKRGYDLIVKKYSLASMGDRYMQFYQNLMN